MERFPSDSALKYLENQLTHGGELAKQLHLLMNVKSSSRETLLYLLNEILNTYDRSLSVMEYGGTSGCAGGCASGDAMVAITSDSPGPPLTGSLHNDHSGPEDQACWISGEKRVPGWTQEAVVFGETGNETQLDDGHSWRKHAHKDILRSKYPSGYYRCKPGKGCLARKQVQRSDEDPTAHEVTYKYKGLHTCHNKPPIPIIQPQIEQKTPLSHENQISQSQQEPFLNIQTSLKTIDSSHDKQCNIPSSSNFNPEYNPIFADDQLLWEDYLLDFMYPTAPELNYFNGYEGLINNSQGIEPAANRPTRDVDSSFDSSSGQFGSSFGSGNSGYFP